MERLAAQYEKKINLSFSIFPYAKCSNLVTEPYNSMLALHKLLEQANSVVVLDNEAVSDICRKSLNVNKPTFANMNNLIAQVIASATESFRYDISASATMQEFEANLVPYPRISSLIPSYSPLLSSNYIHEEHPSVFEMTSNLFDPSTVMVKCDPQKGKYMACTMLYRGNIVSRDISASIAHLKTRRCIKFLDWCSTGLKVSINYQLPTKIVGSDLAKIGREVSMISNNTAITEVFARINAEFDSPYATREHLHMYID